MSEDAIGHEGMASSGRQAAMSSRRISCSRAFARDSRSVVVSPCAELLEAAQARGVQPTNRGAAVLGQADALHPAVIVILAPLREPTPDEVVDHPAGGGHRHVDHLGRLLERQLARLVVEVLEQLDLGERELERADGFEQVGVAVLVEEHDQRVKVAGEGGVVSCLYGVYCLHARKYCRKAS